MNTPNAMQALRRPLRDYAARHFRFTASEDGRVTTVALNRPERKNPLTFDSYAELRDLFRDLAQGSDIRAIVLTGAGGNFSSGGDVFEIIEPLTRMTTPDLLAFTRMTGDVVKAMRKMPAADHRGGRWNLRRGRRHPRHGLRLATCDAGSEDRLSLQPRRPRRRGHGRLWNSAADHRAGPRRGAPVHRPGP